MVIIQLLLTLIALPVVLHLVRILVMNSPGHSKMFEPILTGASGVAVIGLLLFLGAALLGEGITPLEMPTRPVWDEPQF